VLGWTRNSIQSHAVNANILLISALAPAFLGWLLALRIVEPVLAAPAGRLQLKRQRVMSIEVFANRHCLCRRAGYLG